DTAKDEGNETEASRMSKLRRTRKKATKSHLCSMEVGEMNAASSNERIRNQMTCHKMGVSNKPVVRLGYAESHLSHNDKDSQDQTTTIKQSSFKMSSNAPGGESNSNS
ncbi:Hypothetical predicted protein, partial [Marmota monax]